MKKAVSFIVCIFFLTLPLFVSAQEGVDDVTLKLTNTKIDSLLATAAASIEATDYESSLSNLRTARELSEKIGNKKRIGLTSRYLSLLHLQNKDYDKATAENIQAMNALREAKNDFGLAQSYITAAQLHLIKKEYSKANDYLSQAETIFADKNEQSNLAEVYLNKGDVAIAINNEEQALAEYDKALAILNKGQDEYLVAKANAQKAKAYIKLKQFSQASSALKIAQDLASKNTYNKLIIENYKITSELAVQEENYKTGYENIVRFFESQNTSLPKANTSTAQMTIADEEKAQFVKKLNEDILREQEQTIQVTKLTTVLGIALVTIMSLLILSLYKNNNLRAKANELLQAKNTELVIAKENAEKASMVKAQFLSTITHELRTPMYAVTGLTHLLLSENPTEEQKKHLDSLKFSGEYLLSLINNILDLNKLEANKVEVEQTTFNLRKRIEDVLFALEKSAKDKGNKLHLEFDEDIPSEILGDPLMISQILINLVGNAVKFTRDGDVHIRVQKISQSDSDIYLHFEIEDTGEGISKKKQKTIFQNFTQGSVAINRKFGGTGLGLSIVKNLLDLLKSRIQIESTLGKGTKFFFDIKYNLTKNLSEEENPHNIIYDVDYVALENRKILVVEDNKINQMITRKILEKNKMVCDVADNGEIAVEKARTETFDLILMDIHMPGISGIEATEQIRTFDKEIPILALTAVTIDENIDDFYVAGFNDIIPKPYKVEEFFQKIHNGLKKSNVLS